MSDGQTTTKAFGATLSTSEVTIDADGGRFDWSLDYTERTGTEDPSVDVDGDGTADASYSGVLASGETVTREIASLSSGSVTVDTSTTVGPLPDWTIPYDEEIATENPTADLDGDGTADASHSGVLASGQTSTANASGLSTGDNSVTFAVDGDSEVDWSIDYDRVEYTESPSIDVDGDGTAEASYSGLLGPGQTATEELPTLSVDTSSGTVSVTETVDVTTRLQEQTETIDPTVEMNGNAKTYDVTLSDGDTANLTFNRTNIKSGINRVNVSVSENVSADAPVGTVGLDYRHDAQERRSVDYEGNKWSERYNVSKLYESPRNDASLTIPFSNDVVEVDRAQYRLNGGSWMNASTSFDGTTAAVEIGAVNENDTVEVRASGRRVSVGNGTIDVLEPTTAGNDLDTLIEVTSVTGDFYVDVTPSNESRVHHLYSPSWSAEAYTYHDTNGNQRLYLSNVAEGSTTRVRTAPLVVRPSGEIEAVIEDPDDPRLRLRPGSTAGSDRVEIEYLDAYSDETYRLWSMTTEREVDVADSSAGTVVLATDDSAATYVIEVKEESTTTAAVSVAGGGDGGGSGPLSIIALFGGLAGAILVFVLVGRRWFRTDSRRATTLLLVGGSVVGTVGVEAATGRSVISDLAFGLGELSNGGIGAVLVAVTVLFFLWMLDRRLGLPLWLMVAGGLGVGVWLLEEITGGALSEGLSSVSALVWVLILGGGVVLLYRALSGPTIKITGGEN